MFDIDDLGDFSKGDKNYYVNCEQIVEEKQLLQVTRDLAKTLMESSYLSVGDFFKGLSDENLKMLVKEGGEMSDDNPKLLDDMLLLSMMLCTSEGVYEIRDENDVMFIVKHFVQFIILESLYRKGLIKLHRENMTFGSDLGNKPLAEKV